MGIWDDGVKSGAEVYKQDPHISPWSVQMLQDEVQSHRIFIFVWTIVKHLESFEAESSVSCYRAYGSTFHTIPRDKLWDNPNTIPNLALLFVF